MALLGQSALTYGMRRKTPYLLEDIIGEAAPKIRPLLALQDAKKQAAEEAELQRQSMAQSADLAKLSRESSERISSSENELNRALSAASLKSNEAIAEKQNELERARQSLTEKQGNISAGISAAGLVGQFGGLLKDYGKVGTGPGQYSAGSLGAGALAGAGTAYALKDKKPLVQYGGAAAAGLATQWATSGSGGGSIVGDIMDLWKSFKF